MWSAPSARVSRRKCWGSRCGSGPPKSARAEDALSCVAPSGNIWVCSRPASPLGRRWVPSRAGMEGRQGKGARKRNPRAPRARRGDGDLPLHHPARRRAAVAAGVFPRSLAAAFRTCSSLASTSSPERLAGRGLGDVFRVHLRFSVYLF